MTMNIISNKLKTACCAFVLAAAALPQLASADEAGATITPFGIGDFGAGQSPPHTPYGTWALSASYYSASYLKGDDGKRLSTDFQLDVKSVSLAFIYMTEEKFLDATFGFGTVIPVVQIGGHVSTPVGMLSNTDTGVGDIQFLPVILQWDLSKNWFANVSLQVQAPTGNYNTTDAFTAGVGHWSIAPVAAFTYISDEGFEVSSRIELGFNTRNPTTNHTSGVGYKQEYAVGQHFGAWTIGVGGYAYWQLTDDKNPAAPDQGNRGRVFAAGPAITYFEPGKPLVGLHVYQEFGARNRSEGVHVGLRVAMSF